MDEVELSHREAEELALTACLGAGANQASARSLARGPEGTNTTTSDSRPLNR